MRINVQLVNAQGDERLRAETKERLFDAFYSIKSESRGLGMSVVQRIVRVPLPLPHHPIDPLRNPSAVG